MYEFGAIMCISPMISEMKNFRYVIHPKLKQKINRRRNSHDFTDIYSSFALTASRARRVVIAPLPRISQAIAQEASFMTEAPFLIALKIGGRHPFS